MPLSAHRRFATKSIDGVKRKTFVNERRCTAGENAATTQPTPQARFEAVLIIIKLSEAIILAPELALSGGPSGGSQQPGETETEEKGGGSPGTSDTNATTTSSDGAGGGGNCRSSFSRRRCSSAAAAAAANTGIITSHTSLPTVSRATRMRDLQEGLFLEKPGGFRHVTSPLSLLSPLVPALALRE